MNQPNSLHIKSSTEPMARDATDPHCIICGRNLQKLNSDGSIQVSDIKPRFIRQLQKDFPHCKHWDVSTRRLCRDHIQQTLQSRIDFLLEEDNAQLSHLQEGAMKNIHRYEIEESNWQQRFEHERSLGERTADVVAKHGGSWTFVIGLFVFILSWMW